MSRHWGVRSKGGIVTLAESEDKARDWARYDFKGRIGDAGEELVARDADAEEWKVAA